MAKISAVVITKNEEKNIKECLGALSFASEIIVVDSGSTDQTCSLASAQSAKVFVRLFDDFASQKNYAISLASEEWVLIIDADERVSGELANEILQTIQKKDALDGYQIRRRTTFFGKVFKKSGLQNDCPIRLFRKNKARFINPVHEVIQIQGEVKLLNCAMDHLSFQTMRDYWRRLQQYTDIEVRQGDAKKVSNTDFFLRPAGRFFMIYIWRLGFIDGIQGFFYALLSAYYEFIRWAKKWENLQQKKG